MKEIKLTQDKVALVDDEDYERVNQYKWSAKKCGKLYYASRHYYVDSKRTTQCMHQFILQDADKKLMIDHRDGDGLNNQKYNLRENTSRSQNLQNQKPKDNKLKGTTFYNNKYRAQIRPAKNTILHLGYFDTEIEAAKAYDEAARLYFGEYARCNFYI